jgi:hypothetical protein
MPRGPSPGPGGVDWRYAGDLAATMERAGLDVAGA